MKTVITISMLLMLLVACSEMEMKWEQRIDVAGKGNYRIEDIAVPEKALYVTGAYWIDDTKTMCITAKYSDDSKPLWHVLYESPRFRKTEGMSIRLYGSEHGIEATQPGVYVHVRAIDMLGRQNSVLLKYDSLGTLLWEKIVDMPREHREIASTMVLDYGRIYIIDTRRDDRDSFYVFITRYNHNGERLYAAGYDPRLDLRSVQCDIGKSHELLIAGVASPQNNLVYMRFDSLGKIMSLSEYTSPEQESCVVLHSGLDGTVYLCGASRGDNENDCLTLAYDRNDHVLWAQRFEGAAHKNDVPRALVCDDSANVYIIGTSENEKGVPQIVTVKYDSCGNHVWTASFPEKQGEASVPYVVSPNFYEPRKYVRRLPIAGTLGNDMMFLHCTSNGHYVWHSRFSSKGKVSKPTAYSGHYVSVVSESDTECESVIIKYGQCEQLGIARWD